MIFSTATKASCFLLVMVATARDVASSVDDKATTNAIAEVGNDKEGATGLRGHHHNIIIKPVEVAEDAFVTNPSSLTVAFNKKIHHTTMTSDHSTYESTLAKKNHSIFYHAIRESVASGESLLTHIPTADNLSDLMTKVTFGAKRRRLVSGLLYDNFD